VQAKSVKELVELAKQKPKSLNYSSAGVGSPLHLAAELFKKRAGIDMVHVAYKGGGPAAAAVLAGETQVIFGSVASSLPQVKAGRLRALATTGLKRSIAAPELPTMAESGFPGFDVSSWYALMSPAATPAGVAARVRDDAIKVLQLADVQQAMLRQGLDPEWSTPQELAARIKSETAVWAGVVRDAGIKGN
jgi:tripartite-type tricarboxylate transporter receptor subunit TctC